MFISAPFILILLNAIHLYVGQEEKFDMRYQLGALVASFLLFIYIVYSTTPSVFTGMETTVRHEDDYYTAWVDMTKVKTYEDGTSEYRPDRVFLSNGQEFILNPDITEAMEPGWPVEIYPNDDDTANYYELTIPKPPKTSFFEKLTLVDDVDWIIFGATWAVGIISIIVYRQRKDKKDETV